MLQQLYPNLKENRWHKDRVISCRNRSLKNRVFNNFESDDSTVEPPTLEPDDSNIEALTVEPDDAIIEEPTVEPDDSKTEPPTSTLVGVEAKSPTVIISDYKRESLTPTVQMGDTWK